MDREWSDHPGDGAQFGRRLLLTGAAGLVSSTLLWPDDAFAAGPADQLEVPGGLLVPSVRSPGKGQVAITFDDGPHRSTTDDVLAILKRRGAPATFFMTGISAQSYPKVVKRVSAAGHSVQVHSWNHSRLDTKSSAAIRADLTKTKKTLLYLTGRTPVAFRPPYGYTNSTVRQAGAAVGLRHVLWNACPDVSITSASQGLQQVLGHVAIAKRKGIGATILLHDGSGRRSLMLQMLSPLITELRSRGWQLVKYT